MTAEEAQEDELNMLESIRQDLDKLDQSFLSAAESNQVRRLCSAACVCV